MLNNSVKYTRFCALLPVSRIVRRIATNDPNSMFIIWIERRDSYLSNGATITNFDAIDGKLELI